MIRKRSLSDTCDNKRRRINYGEIETTDVPMPTDTKTTLAYIASIFPTEKFKNKFPPIVMRHQIYAFENCPTDVDKELDELSKKGKVRLFKLGEDDQLGVMYTKDYKEFVDRVSRSSLPVDKFLKNVVSVCPDISYSTKDLKEKFGLHEDDITELIQKGVLTCRDVGWFWLSIPRIGEFMTAFLYGRKAILKHFQQTNNKEILQNELEQRKLPRKALLGTLYHIYDLIGSDAVAQVETSSGIALCLQPELI